MPWSRKDSFTTEWSGGRRHATGLRWWKRHANDSLFKYRKAEGFFAWAIYRRNPHLSAWVVPELPFVFGKVYMPLTQLRFCQSVAVPSSLSNPARRHSEKFLLGVRRRQRWKYKQSKCVGWTYANSTNWFKTPPTRYLSTSVPLFFSHSHDISIFFTLRPSRCIFSFLSGGQKFKDGNHVSSSWFSHPGGPQTPKKTLREIFMGGTEYLANYTKKDTQK